MQSGRASRTAEGAAAARALHARHARPVVFDDPYAVYLTSGGWRRLVQAPLLSLWADRVLLRSLRPIQGQVVVRSRYAEEKLEQAMERGLAQYVIIGAGFDSFALRRPELGAKLRIFEIDHPDTQSEKRARLEKLLEELGEGMPSHVEFVAIDFETEALGDALARSTYDASSPAFFSWLGTTPYLSPEATEKTLRAVAEHSASGSEIVFDYLIPASMVPASEQQTMAKLKEFTDRRGEPLIGEFDPDGMEAFLSPLGLGLLENLSCEEQVRRYFSGRRDNLRPMAAGYLAHARVL